jgi:hypothetical protein
LGDLFPKVTVTVVVAFAGIAAGEGGKTCGLVPVGSFMVKSLSGDAALAGNATAASIVDAIKRPKNLRMLFMMPTSR